MEKKKAERRREEETAKEVFHNNGCGTFNKFVLTETGQWAQVTYSITANPVVHFEENSTCSSPRDGYQAQGFWKGIDFVNSQAHLHHMPF